LKNLKKRELLPEKHAEITKKIREDIVKKNSLATYNMVVLMIVLIIYGFYTDIFDGYVDFFKAGTSHVSRISGSLSCGK